MCALRTKMVWVQVLTVANRRNEKIGCQCGGIDWYELLVRLGYTLT